MRFGKIVPLAGVSFTVGVGEVVALLGDNGAGKSTMVKIIAGIHRASAGEILIDGRPHRGSTPGAARKAGVETVHQDLALVETMSIARNFFLGAEPRKRGLLDIRRMEHDTAKALADIGLQNIRNTGQDVSALSGGERQAISIGRAVAFGTRLLILDEPTSALSVAETNKVFSYVRHAKQTGLSVIIIMHNLEQVRQAADRFVVLEHGRKIADVPNTGQDEVALISMLSSHA
jgi:simple sugar transport system ATP-binding protein